MFSHANEYADIVADESKRRKAEKAKAKAAEEKRILKKKRQEEKWNKVLEEEKRRAQQDDDERKKRRRIGSEELGLGLRSSSPTSPLPTISSPYQDTLGSRYEVLTRSSGSGSASSAPGKTPTVIDLGSGSDGDANTELSDTEIVTRSSRQRTIPRLESKPVPTAENDSDSDVQVVDSVTEELEARIRARAAKNEHKAPTKEERPSHVVQLLIDTRIPGTNPLLIKVRSSSTLEKIRKAWCVKQNYTPEQTKSVFLTWNGKRLFDSTRVERCGIRINAEGYVTVDGSTDIYTEDDPPKVALEAWTDQTLREFKKAKAEEEEAQRKEDEKKYSTQEPVAEPEPTQQKKLRLILKARGKDDFKIGVKPDTTFELLTAAYRQKLGIADTQPITLMFDGERLRPMDTVEDADIDDMDVIEVHLK